MKQYKCPTLGDCDKANSGHIFDKEMGDDLHCTECNTILVSVESDIRLGVGKKTKIPLIIAGVLALAGVAAVGAYFASHSLKKEIIEPLTESPEQVKKTAQVEPLAINVPAVTQVNSGIPAPISPTDVEITKSKRDSQDALLKGEAKEAEESSNRATAKEMLKTGIAQMAQGKMDDAEKTFDNAKSLDPKQSLIYYNTAILRLKQGRSDDAMKEFEASFMAGFKYFDKIDSDSDLDSLRKDPRFMKIVQKYR